MNFFARTRLQSESLVITIPNEIVEMFKLKSGIVYEFEIKKGDNNGEKYN